MRNLWILIAVVTAVVGGLYLADVLPERGVGAALIFAAVLLPAPLTALRVVQDVTNAQGRAALLGIGLLCGLLGGVALYSAIFPGEARFFGSLNAEQKVTDIGSVAGGAYLLSVEGALPEREGEVNVDYKVSLAVGDAEQQVKGELWRRFDQVRVGKRGTAMAEHHRTFGRHTVVLKEGQGKVSLVSSSIPLTLSFKLFKILLPTSVMIIVFALLFVAGSVVEGRFGSDRVRGAFATALAFTAGASYLYPDQMTESAFVKPAIGVIVTSVFFAIFVGGATAAILRKLLRKTNEPGTAQ
jgi:hypothetical protein